MQTKIRMTTVALLLFISVGTRAQQNAGSARDAFQADGTNVSENVAQLIQEIEAPQVPYRQGLDGLTLQEVMEHFHTPGVSVAVIKDFKVHWAKGYGIADGSTGRPVQVDTLFQAASISKPVMAMAALRLVQEGRFSLDDDVNNLLKSWRVPESDLTRDQAVTPRSLLSHTSGSDDAFGFPGYDPGVLLPSLVQILNGQPPSNRGPVLFKRRPYQAYKYSGGGIVIMQVLLGDLTGESFAGMMERIILGPLGLKNSTYQQPLPESLASRAARAHNEEGKESAVPWHLYPEQAAAGLWTTPSDLARVAIELQRALRGPSGSILNESTAREMIAPTGSGPFAIGFEISKRGEGWYFSHSGGNWGFQCHLLAHVRKGYGVVIMTNGNGGGQVIDEIESRVAAAYHWDSLDKPLFR